MVPLVLLCNRLPNNAPLGILSEGEYRTIISSQYWNFQILSVGGPAWRAAAKQKTVTVRVDGCWRRVDLEDGPRQSAELLAKDIAAFCQAPAHVRFLEWFRVFCTSPNAILYLPGRGAHQPERDPLLREVTITPRNVIFFSAALLPLPETRSSLSKRGHHTRKVFPPTET